MKVSIIGAGAFGTALANQIAKNGHEVLIWSFEKHVAVEINELHRNNQFLPEVTLHKSIKASSDLKEVVNFSQTLLNATPVFATRQTYKDLNLDGKILISASKGIEKGTHKLLSEIFSETVEGKYFYGILSGPSFAKELASGATTAVTVASENNEILETAREIFEAANFKIEFSKDVIGAELSGSLKNVLAIASGLAAGAGFGKNYQAAVFVEGLNEMIAVGEKMGAKKKTFYSLAGLGDLFLTSTSDQSRNFSFGFRLGQGETSEQASEGKTVEGMGSAESAFFLAQKYGVSAPLFENIYDTVLEKKKTDQALKDIWSSLKF